MSNFTKKLKQAKNITMASARSLERKVAGDPVRVADEVGHARWKTCKGCNEFIQDSQDDGKGKCKICGCGMENKVWWASESCPLHKWGVEDMVSIIIPYYDEPYLKQTIKSLKDNADGPLQIIAEEDVDREGMRVVSNRAVAQAHGKYLFFVDAHCSMSAGWDEELKKTCEAGTLVYGLIRDMKMDKWEYCSANYGPVYLDSDLHEVWDERPDLPREMIQESMAFTGCGFMMRYDDFQRFGTYNESLCTFWGVGPEWSLKFWLSGGRVLMNRNVTCGHGFRWGDNLPVRQYHTGDNEAYRKLMQLVRSGQLEGQTHSLRWLVDKFSPVPTWTPELIEACEIKETEYVSEIYA